MALFAARSEQVPFKGVLERVGFTAMGFSSILIVLVLAAAVLHVRGPGASTRRR